MRKILYIFALIVAAITGYSCQDDNVVYIGNSLSQSISNIVVDSSFTVSGRSILNQRIESRTVTQLLGAIKAENYGELRSDVVTQFMPAAKIDTTHVTEDLIDSTRLVMYIAANTGFFGDSIVPMRMNVYKLNKQLPSTIYSDFDPSEYYDKADLIASRSYCASDLGQSEKVKASHYIFNQSTNQYYQIRQIPVRLPDEIGKMLFRTYIENPDILKSPKEFAKLFPGVYIANSFGTGRVMNFYDTEVEVFYRRKYVNSNGNDTIVADSASYLAATPEIITNNNISLKIDEKITARVAAGEPIIMAPAGYEVQIDFPLQAIIDKFMNDPSKLKVLNSIQMTIPTQKIENDYNIAQPEHVLLIKRSDRDEFFSKKKLPDQKSSFLGTYDPTYKGYVFTGLRDYVVETMNKNNGIVEADDADFLIVPVDVTQIAQTQSSYYYYYYGSSEPDQITVKVMPQISALSLAKLDLENALVVLTYSTQSIASK